MIKLNKWLPGCDIVKGSNAVLFALHTTMAALMALGIATVFGIRHPWWAAMTVWLVAQPTRGLFLERSAARLAGTAAGASIGYLSLLFYFDTPVLLVGILGVWVGLCAGLGNIFRHFRNYGFVLAGYTASVVALFGLNTAEPDLQFAGGRVACTVIGILCSAVISCWFATTSRNDKQQKKLDVMVCGCLEWCQLERRHEAEAHYRQVQQMLLNDIALLEPLTDQLAAGSLTGRRIACRFQAILTNVVEIIALVERQHYGLSSLPRLPGQQDREPFTAQQAERDCGLHALMASRQHLQEIYDGSTIAPVSFYQRLRAHDWHAAAAAAARPVIAMSLTTVLWLSTGWQYGPVMVMTATMFACLFSSNINGDHALSDVFIGSLAGAIGGLFYRWYVFPFLHSVLLLLLAIVPFLMIGAFLMARPKTAKMAIDVNMTFLLASQPTLAMATDYGIALNQVVAILCGVLAAIVVYRLILPANTTAVRYRLARHIARLTESLCNETPSSRSTYKPIAASRALLRLLVIDPRISTLTQRAMLCVALVIIGVEEDSDSAGVNEYPVKKSRQMTQDLQKAVLELKDCIVNVRIHA